MENERALFNKEVKDELDQMSYDKIIGSKDFKDVDYCTKAYYAMIFLTVFKGFQDFRYVVEVYNGRDDLIVSEDNKLTFINDLKEGTNLKDLITRDYEDSLQDKADDVYENSDLDDEELENYIENMYAMIRIYFTYNDKDYAISVEDLNYEINKDENLTLDQLQENILKEYEC